MQYQPLDELKKHPDWGSLGEVLQEYVGELLDLRKIDSSLSATAYKTEALSRLRAAEAVLEFYRNHGFAQRRLEDLEVRFD